jgi:hypothetical protein
VGRSIEPNPLSDLRAKHCHFGANPVKGGQGSRISNASSDAANSCSGAGSVLCNAPSAESRQQKIEGDP